MPAWNAVVSALAIRPCHPEAWLLLAEIAGQAGDAKRMQECADRARARDELLWTLWLYGRRRIDRAEFEPFARDALARELLALADRAAKARSERDELMGRLHTGIATTGKLKGKPYSEAGRVGLTSKIRRAERLLREYERRRELILAEPDPLRAWGLLPAAVGVEVR